MDGRAALRTRSIVSLLPRMAEVWFCDPRRLCADPRFAQQIVGSEVCVRDPRIIVQKLGSKVCAAKSSDGPNPYFSHNISNEYGVHYIHSIWSTLYTLNMEYIISTQYGVHYIHSIWSTLYPLNMEYIISTQYGVHYIHSIWSTLYPLNMEYIISTQYGVHYIHSIWSTLYPLNMECNFPHKVNIF